MYEACTERTASHKRRSPLKKARRNMRVRENCRVIRGARSHRYKPAHRPPYIFNYSLPSPSLSFLLSCSHPVFIIAMVRRQNASCKRFTHSNVRSCVHAMTLTLIASMMNEKNVDCARVWHVVLSRITFGKIYKNDLRRPRLRKVI